MHLGFRAFPVTFQTNGMLHLLARSGTGSRIDSDTDCAIPYTLPRPGVGQYLRRDGGQGPTVERVGGSRGLCGVKTWWQPRLGGDCTYPNLESHHRLFDGRIVANANVFAMPSSDFSPLGAISTGADRFFLF